MLGLVLIGFGLVSLVSGIAIQIKNSNSSVAKSTSQLEKAIEMAIADGVITENEKQVIRDIATNEGLNYEKIILETEIKLSNLSDISETVIINQRKKKGDDFEGYVVGKFERKYFKLKNWASDKIANGIYPESSLNPDLLYQFKLGEYVEEFSVECKWRQRDYKGAIEFTKPEQLKRYKQFERDHKTNVFIVLGLGGKPSAPVKLYSIPLSKIESHRMTLNELKLYEKNITGNFFYDYKESLLK